MSAQPKVRLHIRTGTAPAAIVDVGEVGFLIGSVPGCDLRLPGADLPPVICRVARCPEGVSVRKLTPALPVLVNGRAVSSAVLAHGDRLTLRSVELQIAIEPGGRTQAPPLSSKFSIHDLERWAEQLGEQQRQLQHQQHALEERAHELEADRVLWYRRREEVEREYLQRSEAVQALARQLREQESALAAARADGAPQAEALDRQQRELQAAQEQLAQQQRALEAARQELATVRQKAYEQYRERQGRLAERQEAVNVAAQKVQERKRQVDAEVEQNQARAQALTAREAELQMQARRLLNAGEVLAEERRKFEQQQRELAERVSQCQAAEQKLAEDRTEVEKRQAQHQADLLRLDRLSATLEQRTRQLQARALEVDQQAQQLQRATRELEEQAVQLDEKRVEIEEQTAQLAQRKTEQEMGGTQLAQRSAALEGQQAMLTMLRGRLERMRDEVRREAQQLTEQRVRQETAEADLQQQLQQVEQQRLEVENERQLQEQERRQFEERAAVMESAVGQLRQAQEALAQEETAFRQRAQELESRMVAYAEEAALLRARTDQLTELQQRVEADRRTLRDRETALAQAEQARETLQEQLRRRSEELAARQRGLVEQDRRRAEETGAIETRRAEIEAERRRAEESLAQLRTEIEKRTTELQQQEGQLTQRENQFGQREEAIRRAHERLKEVGRTVAAGRKALHARRASLKTEEQTQAAAIAQGRAAADTARLELQALVGQLPELELRTRTALEGLARSREQLRDHLAELHAYARQGQADLETLRAKVLAEAEQVRQQEVALRGAREEHRLAVATFRQQVIEWQGQVAELKRTLAADETRLERRQAEVDAQARQMDAASARLAREAQELEEQQRVVAERRGEMERHLADMREWYRRKLRELSQNAGTAPKPAAGAADRDILALTSDVDPGDRQLGELLQSLGLVEADTLTSLLVEARRQRRSLRQALLASGYLTLYQLALIEAGNLDGLVLGPVRVVDRLRVTARETVYRVFDPRRSQEAILRHLAESEMEDAVHPDEFRQRFAAAVAVQYPHLAATWEVLEIAGRPAVLQEWLVGLSSADWPPWVAVPGVWFRLLSQAALGLHMAHAAGLVNGRLQASSILLTSEGVVKLCGFGEPPWLEVPAAGADTTTAAAPPGEAAADLAALGTIATAWLTLARGPESKKGKATEPLQPILDRFRATTPEEGYASAAALLEQLDQISSAVPPNAAAWERLLRHVREQLATDAALKQSA